MPVFPRRMLMVKPLCVWSQVHSLKPASQGKVLLLLYIVTYLYYVWCVLLSVCTQNLHLLWCHPSQWRPCRAQTWHSQPWWKAVPPSNWSGSEEQRRYCLDMAVISLWRTTKLFSSFSTWTGLTLESTPVRLLMMQERKAALLILLSKVSLTRTHIVIISSTGN